MIIIETINLSLESFNNKLGLLDPCRGLWWINYVPFFFHIKFVPKVLIWMYSIFSQCPREEGNHLTAVHTRQVKLQRRYQPMFPLSCVQSIPHYAQSTRWRWRTPRAHATFPHWLLHFHPSLIYEQHTTPFPLSLQDQWRGRGGTLGCSSIVWNIRFHTYTHTYTHTHHWQDAAGDMCIAPFRKDVVSKPLKWGRLFLTFQTSGDKIFSLFIKRQLSYLRAFLRCHWYWQLMFFPPPLKTLLSVHASIPVWGNGSLLVNAFHMENWREHQCQPCQR